MLFHLTKLEIDKFIFEKIKIVKISNYIYTSIFLFKKKIEMGHRPQSPRIAPSLDICAISINMHLLIVLESGLHRSELCKDLPTYQKKKKKNPVRY